MEKIVSLLMAGGIGERLKPLTKERAKAAVPFAGKFRLIDFTLSNCINSGIRQIYVLTQYRSWSLQRHIQEGWSISSSGLGDFIYPMPAQQKMGAVWYRGTADAVRQNLDLVRDKDFDHVLILSGDHVYKMHYIQLLDYHKRKKAGLTISAVRVRKEHAAHRLGVIEVDRENCMVGFEEKPAEPRTIPGAPDYVLASMGVFVFETQALIEALQGPEDDFGKEVIPRMKNKNYDVFVYDYQKENRIEDYIVQVKDGKREKVLVERTPDSGYWRDVGTIDEYYEASMDLVGIDPLFNLYGEKWTLRTFQRPLPPSKCVLGGKTPESIVCEGCIISGGTVWNSILSPGVVVERDAFIEQSIVFDDVNIEPGARARRAIIDKEARLLAGAQVGYDAKADRQRGCTITDSGIVVVPRGLVIAPA